MRRHAAPPGARRAARQRPEERGSVAGGLRGRRAGPRWACMLLQYARAKGAKDHDGDGSSSGGNSTFAVQGSTLMRNKVVQAGTGQNAEGLCQLGMGAVVLTADDSWVLDPPPPAAAALAGQQPTVGPAAPQGQSFKQQTPAAVPPSAAGPLVPQPHSVFGVELRGVVAERNTGGSGALFALLDLRVASVRLVRCSLTRNSAFRGGVVHAGSSGGRLGGGADSSISSSSSSSSNSTCLHATRWTTERAASTPTTSGPRGGTATGCAT